MNPTIHFVFVKCFRIILDIISGIYFGLKYWGAKPTILPPIKNRLVTESAISLAQKIRTRKVPSEEVVRSFIKRIREVNPILNAIVQERFEEALQEAKEVDSFLRSTNKNEIELANEKPFLGVPFTIKDFYGVKGLKHTCGMWARKDIVAKEDSECVRLMKEAGAIILGVTNVPEFCMWWETFNSIYGRTNNPYDVNRIPGGSSGGEGSLIAACGTPLGIGSDIGGSIRMPSFFNGLFGHKPTSGIVSNKGAEPELMGTHDLYSVTGPICKYAEDAAAMFKVLAGKNLHSLSLDRKVNLKDLKIYYMENEGGNPLISPVDREITQAQHKVLKYFEKEYNIRPVKINIKYFYDAIEIFFAKLKAEEKSYSYAYEIGNREKEINGWTEGIKCLFGLSKYSWPALFHVIHESITKSTDIQKYLEDCDKMDLEIKTLLGNDGIFLFPTHPTTALYHKQTLFCPFDFAYTGIMNIIKVPSTQCPLGLSTKGLPLGIQVVANQYQDHLCLAVAQEIEKAFGGWVNPSQEL